jgi:N-acetylmuramoyl-L-alanine amidase
MKRQLRQQSHLRHIKILVLILLLVIISGTIVSCAINNNQALNTGRSKSVPSPDTSSSTPVTTKYKIVIDAGHGGKDPGADGASGMKEKEYTLSLCKKVYELLKQEPMFEPYMTRTDDTFVQLLDRAKLANDLKANALISIHANFYTDPHVTGTETYYSFDNSIKIAQVVHEHLVKSMGFRDRGVRNNQLKVLVHSNMPATLIEIGYITNKNQEATMVSSDGQIHAAQAIVDGLKQYFIDAAPPN